MADTQRAEVIRILDLYDAYSHVNVSYVSLDSNPNIVNETVGQASAAAYSEGDYIVKSGNVRNGLQQTICLKRLRNISAILYRLLTPPAIRRSFG